MEARAQQAPQTQAPAQEVTILPTGWEQALKAHSDALEAEARENGWNLDKFVGKAIDLDDEVVLAALVALKSPLARPTPELEALAAKVTPPSPADELEEGFPMRAWVRVLEMEAMARGIARWPDAPTPKPTAPAPLEAEAPKPLAAKELAPKRRKSCAGSEAGRARTSREAPKATKARASREPRHPDALVARVGKARDKGMSFSALEAKFGLRPCNGMTAYRLVAKWPALKRKLARKG